MGNTLWMRSRLGRSNSYANLWSPTTLLIWKGPRYLSAIFLLGRSCCRLRALRRTHSFSTKVLCVRPWSYHFLYSALARVRSCSVALRSLLNSSALSVAAGVFAWCGSGGSGGPRGWKPYSKYAGVAWVAECHELLYAYCARMRRCAQSAWL